MEIHPEKKLEYESRNWHINKIKEAIKTDDVQKVWESLLQAWAEGEYVTQKEIDEHGEMPSVGEQITHFFLKKIKENKFSPAERRSLYKRTLPYDQSLAPVFIERILPQSLEDIENYEEGQINPPELYSTQMEYYKFLIEEEDIALLENALEIDGHLDNSALYDLDEDLKREIIEYSRNVFIEKEDMPASFFYQCAKRILHSFDSI